MGRSDTRSPLNGSMAQFYASRAHATSVSQGGSSPRRLGSHFPKEVRMGLVVTADAQTEAALLEILERFCSRFAARDAEGVMQLFARDADVVMVTSEEALLRGPDEVRAFLRRYVQ